MDFRIYRRLLADKHSVSHQPDVQNRWPLERNVGGEVSQTAINLEPLLITCDNDLLEALTQRRLGLDEDLVPQLLGGWELGKVLQGGVV